MKAQDMFDKNYFSHTIPGTEYTLTSAMAKYTNDECVSSSENIYWGKATETNTTDSAVQWWMNSKPHKQAILNGDYTKTGFGISGSKVVQHFCIAK